MKKVVLLAVMMVFMASMAWSAEICYTCPKDTDTCTIPTRCYPTDDQADCLVVQPCNWVVEICECVDEETGLTIFRENNTLGFKFLSMTPGVYFAYDPSYDLIVKLFAKGDAAGACAAKDPNRLDPNWVGLGAGDPNFPGHMWDGVDSLYYLDNTGSKILSLIDEVDSNGLYDCDPAKITGISTCLNKDQGGLPTQTYWTIDYQTTDIDYPRTDGDNDGDGEEGEDAIGWYGHLVATAPQVVLNWDEIDPALYGTYAKVRLYILQVTDLDSLCPGCEDLCYCEEDVVKLCDVKTISNCVYFQYGLLGADGWTNGLALTNTDLDSVSVDEMSVDVTIVDAAGVTHTATFADFETLGDGPVAAMLLPDWLTLFGLTDVADGALYIEFQANFNIDAYMFYKYEKGDASNGCGAEARYCGWPNCGS